MESKKIWHVWEGRSWPMLPEEEVQFVSDLKNRVNQDSIGKKPSNTTFDRGDVTTVVNALRCGVTAQSLLLQAPGLSPSRLLAAYTKLNKSRLESVKAWESILEEKTIDSLLANKMKAQRIMPIALNRLLVSSQQSGVRGLMETCDSVQRASSSINQTAVELEEILRSVRHVDRVMLGCKLYNPYEPSIWGDIFYMPERVTTLMPVKITDLLQERTDARKLR